jgi:phosphonopyruvate decarboxylase
MIHARDFVEPARERGYRYYAGVPCSFLTPFINFVIGDARLNYVSAANEGDAVAIAAGAWIGGQRSVAMMQNSGLGNAVSPLTSLTHTFEIPIVLICTHRGAPGVSDEPQHELMGVITEQLFSTMRIANEVFPRTAAEVQPVLNRIEAHARSAQRPYALIMQKGTCEPYPLPSMTTTARPAPVAVNGAAQFGEYGLRPSRSAVLNDMIAATADRDTVVIATTGFTGRELFALADRPNHLYIVGSMGCASSLALGLALARPDLRIVVIDGDGAALMRMGNLATIGAYAPANLVHVLLDNEAHDSTGAQATVSATTDFAGVAAACGYRHVYRSDQLADLSGFLNAGTGPNLLHMKIRTGTIDDLPRPSMTPPAVLARLMRHIGTAA